MSTHYIPDNWIVIKMDVKDKEVLYKILGGWSGGYLDSDSWRLNSGITKIVETDTTYEVHGYSSSVYTCRKGSEEVRMNIAGILPSLQEKFKEQATIERVNMENILEEFTS